MFKNQTINKEIRRSKWNMTMKWWAMLDCHNSTSFQFGERNEMFDC
ncbi:hypothetical protein BRARA_C01528 [Brassica rapa]|uniref:Uncharacterized protein n=1 Tax=Brassica campestris TaxID=3711 RepID=A0A397ZYB3_BRACM|nr:hypothetical protein BRARA_C01528 [Brassica rapa]